MLDHLSEFLQGALQRSRDLTSTLGHELHIVESYLAIMRIRMGDKLHFEIDVAPSARDVSFPGAAAADPGGEFDHAWHWSVRSAGSRVDPCPRGIPAHRAHGRGQRRRVRGAGQARSGVRAAQCARAAGSLLSRPRVIQDRQHRNWAAPKPCSSFRARSIDPCPPRSLRTTNRSQRRELHETLAELWPELSVLAEYGDGAAALATFEDVRPDMAFLDIRMPRLTGLEVAERIQGECLVVFVTAYDEHAVAAFEQGAADYLLKPIKPARVAATVARLRQRLAQRAGDARADAICSGSRPPLANTLRCFMVDAICCFRSDVKYTRVVSAGAEGSFVVHCPHCARTWIQRGSGRSIAASSSTSITSTASCATRPAPMTVRLRNGMGELPVSKSHQSQSAGCKRPPAPQRRPLNLRIPRFVANPGSPLWRCPDCGFMRNHLVVLLRNFGATSSTRQSTSPARAGSCLVPAARVVPAQRADVRPALPELPQHLPVVNEFTMSGKSQTMVMTADALGPMLKDEYPAMVLDAVRFRPLANEGGIAMRRPEQPQNVFYWENGLLC